MRATEKLFDIAKQKHLFALVVMIVTVSLLLFGQTAFADDIATTEETVTASIKCGEHGTVNEKTGDFTETISAGNDLHLEFKADKGYVIGNVLVNDEALSDEDMTGITGETAGVLDLEDLEDDLSIQVDFKASGNAAGQSGTDDNSSVGNAGTDPLDQSDAVSGSDNSESGTDTGIVPATSAVIEDQELEDQTSSANSSEQTSADAGADVVSDETGGGDIDAYNPDEYSDSEAGYDEEGGSSDTADGYDGIKTDIGTAASVDRTGSDADDVSDDNAGSGNEKKESADSDDAGAGKGDYYGTPKTGDGRSLQAYSFVISGLTLILLSLFICRHRRTAGIDREGR